MGLDGLAHNTHTHKNQDPSAYGTRSSVVDPHDCRVQSLHPCRSLPSNGPAEPRRSTSFVRHSGQTTRPLKRKKQRCFFFFFFFWRDSLRLPASSPSGRPPRTASPIGSSPGTKTARRTLGRRFVLAAAVAAITSSPPRAAQQRAFHSSANSRLTRAHSSGVPVVCGDAVLLAGGQPHVQRPRRSQPSSC